MPIVIGIVGGIVGGISGAINAECDRTAAFLKGFFFGAATSAFGGFELKVLDGVVTSGAIGTITSIGSSTVGSVAIGLDAAGSATSSECGCA